MPGQIKKPKVYKEYICALPSCEVKFKREVNKHKIGEKAYHSRVCAQMGTFGS